MQPTEKTFHFFLILTFIGSGISCLSYLLTGLNLSTIQTMIESEAIMTNAEMKAMVDTFKPLISAPWSLTFFLLNGLLYGVSLAGAIFMWNLKRYGFHLYTIAQLLLIALPIFFIGKDAFDMGNLMITLFFVTFYFFALRNLTQTETNDKEEVLKQATDEEDDNEEEDEEDEDD